MKRIAFVLPILIIAGCHESVATAPSAPAAPVVVAAPAAAQCQPFDLQWQIDTNSSAPWTALIPSQNINGYEVQERSGDPWQMLTVGVDGLMLNSLAFQAHFDMAYRVKAKVGNCWSNWHEFKVGPANGNYSGEAPSPVSPVDSYSETRCTVAKDFSPGMSEILSFNKGRAGVYNVTVATYDENHKAGYQPGQVENVIVSGFGVTDDIDDNAHGKFTVWTTTLPIDELRVTGNMGSLHGDPSAVCVTVEGR